MKGYRTLIVNAAAAALPVVDFIANNGDLVQAVMKEHGAAAVSVLALVNMILRWVTTTPILKAE